MILEKISARQVSTLCFFLIRSLFLLLAIPFLLTLSQNDALIAIPLGTLLGLIPLFLFLSLRKHGKNKNLFEMIQTSFSKGIATILNVLLFVGLLFLSTYLTFLITSYIHYSLIPQIGLLIITATFLLLALQIAMKGLETLCRTSEIFIFAFLLLFGISLLGLSSYVDINYIRPFFSHQLTSIVQSAILFASFATGPLCLLTMIPQNHIVDKKNETKYILRSYLLSALVIWIFYFLTVSILGNQLALSYQYPTTIILKKVTFLKIIERLEGVLSIHWLFDLTLLLSCLLLSLKEGIKTVFSVKKEKSIQKAMILVSLFLFLGSNYIPHQEKYYAILFLLVAFFIPTILFLKQQLKK